MSEEEQAARRRQHMEHECELHAKEVIGLLQVVESLEPMLELADQLEAQARMLRESYRGAKAEWQEKSNQGTYHVNKEGVHSIV